MQTETTIVFTCGLADAAGGRHTSFGLTSHMATMNVAVAALFCLLCLSDAVNLTPGSREDRERQEAERRAHWNAVREGEGSSRVTACCSASLAICDRLLQVLTGLPPTRRAIIA